MFNNSSMHHHENTERNEGNLCTHEELYVIEFVTILFYFADILATDFQYSSVHALPREIWHGYV